MKLFAVAIALLSVAACTTGASTAGRTNRDTITQNSAFSPRDVHGDPATLLPVQPNAWTMVECAQARTSPHWPRITAAIATSPNRAQLDQIIASLGFDPLAQSTRMAVASYGDVSTQESSGSAVLVAQGGFDRARVLASMAEHGGVLRDERIGAFTVQSNSQSAVIFAAQDVVLLFDPGLAVRVVRQLSGEEPSDVTRDPQFAALWSQPGMTAPSVARFAANASSVRRRISELSPQASRLERAVGLVRGLESLEIRVLGAADSAAGAAAIATELEATRRDYAGRFLLRLLGFGRLLQQGITVVSEEHLVRLTANATSSEVQSIFGAAQAGQLMR
ncbi:MAG: hypothetical protein Q8Q09_11920 [Deltaproteobacteria bacterium]|nr:hypothetical protein [Deltaproteobacteria bacterium]